MKLLGRLLHGAACSIAFGIIPLVFYHLYTQAVTAMGLYGAWIAYLTFGFVCGLIIYDDKSSGSGRKPPPPRRL